MSLRRDRSDKWWQRLAEFFGLRKRRFVMRTTWLDDSLRYDGPADEGCSCCDLKMLHTVHLHKFSLHKRDLHKKMIDEALSGKKNGFAEMMFRALENAEREMRDEERQLPWWAT